MARIFLTGTVVVGLGEAILRGWVHFRHGVPGKSIGRWVADETVGAKMAPLVYDHRMQTNDGGFRGSENLQTKRPEGSLRILAYGGSTTLCWNLKDPDTWPRRLEVELRATLGNDGTAVQVLNAGDINWSMAHVLARAEKELPELLPDVVLLYSGVNEVGNRQMLEMEGTDFAAVVEDGTIGLIGTSFPQATWLGQNSILFRAVQGRVLRPLLRAARRAQSSPWDVWQEMDVATSPGDAEPDPLTLLHYLRTLRRFAELCEENNVKLVFVTQASGRKTVALERLTSYSRVGGAELERSGHLVVDAQRLVDSQRLVDARVDVQIDAEVASQAALFAESGVHFSARGARLFALYLATEISWKTLRASSTVDRISSLD